jgi:hypothetical protein
MGADMRLELLLAHADDGKPVLPEGLREETLQAAPRPVPLELPQRLWDENRDANLLSRQRWGLVVPKGADGDRLLEVVAPLQRIREEAQEGAPARIYRVQPGMDGPAAARWRKSEFWKENVSEPERPRYLLILGDLDQVSFELQQVLSTDAYVGRLAFPNDEGYSSYVEKVLHWERMLASAGKVRLLVYTAKDGSWATRIGHEELTGPGLEACRNRKQQAGTPELEPLELIDDGSAPGERLLACASEPGPSVLFSLSHGLGRPIEGWKSPGEQRALQGALHLPGKRYLTAKDLARRTFLPGGMWFYFACFSVGTPAQSAYTPWLRQLAKTDPEAARRLERVLLQGEERPFIAALPQAVLANPNGPLAVIGHVDLAWTYSFRAQGQGTPSRFFKVLEALAEGQRAGAAMRLLLRFMSHTNDELTWLYHKEERARQAGRPYCVDESDRARLWMLRHDLAGYALLGDPAVRLPLVTR